MSEEIIARPDRRERLFYTIMDVMSGGRKQAFSVEDVRNAAMLAAEVNGILGDAPTEGDTPGPAEPVKPKQRRTSKKTKPADKPAPETPKTSESPAAPTPQNPATPADKSAAKITKTVDLNDPALKKLITDLGVIAKKLGPRGSEMQRLLKNYNVTKVSELDPKVYDNFLAACEKLVE